MGFGEPGGVPHNLRALQEGATRAQLIELINVACLQHAPQVADLILAHYKVRRRTSATKGWSREEEKHG